MTVSLTGYAIDQEHFGGWTGAATAQWVQLKRERDTRMLCEATKDQTNSKGKYLKDKFLIRVTNFLSLWESGKR